MTRPPTPPGGSTFWKGAVRGRSRPRARFAATPWDRMASALARIDAARATDVMRTAFTSAKISDGRLKLHCPLEADNPATDRTMRGASVRNILDRHMGRQAEAGAGAIYALYRGEISQLFPASRFRMRSASRLTARSAISPTPAQQCALSRRARPTTGLPRGTPEVLLRHRPCRRARRRGGRRRRPDLERIWGRRLCRRLQSARRTPALAAGAGAPVELPGVVGPELSGCWSRQPGRHGRGGARGRSEHGRTFVMEVAARGRPEPDVKLASQ